MTYTELSAEYNNTANIIIEKIKALKSERCSIPIEKGKELDRRIYMLYGMYLDCRHIGKLLVNRKGEF